jgi:hypothetical protein
MAVKMDITTLANQMNKRIKRLEQLTGELEDAGEAKALAIAEYDKAYAIAMAKIGLGTVNQIEGEKLPENRPATVLGKYAAGLCHEQKCEMIKAESKYKSLLTKIEVLEATLNAKQSINRYLSHEAR